MSWQVSDTQLIDDARRLARKFTPFNFSREDREDIQQEVVLALLEARERFDPKRASWGVWAFIRARGAVQDYMRSHIIRDRDVTRSGVVTRFTSYEAQPYEASTNQEYNTLYYREYLKTLNKREKFIVVCLMRGYSPAEIGRMTNISPTGLSRLLQRLRIESIQFFSLHHKD